MVNLNIQLLDGDEIDFHLAIDRLLPMAHTLVDLSSNTHNLIPEIRKSVPLLN